MSFIWLVRLWNLTDNILGKVGAVAIVAASPGAASTGFSLAGATSAMKRGMFWSHHMRCCDRTGSGR